MKQTVNKLTTNFFIENSSGKVEKEINQLSYLGRQHFFLRDYNSVMAIAERLLNMSDRANTVGQELLGRVLSRQPATREQADALFRNLTGSPDPITRAGAFLHLTSREVLVYENLDEAIYFANKALPLALAHSPLVFAQLQDVLSIILSLKGDHKGSIQLLEENLKLTRQFRFHPFLHLNALNSLASELCEEQTDYAAHLIKQVSETPYFSLYPEWQDTYMEVLEAQATKQLPRIFKGVNLKKKIPNNNKTEQLKNLVQISRYLKSRTVGEEHIETKVFLNQVTDIVRPFRPPSPYVRRLEYKPFLDILLIDSSEAEMVGYSMEMDNYPLQNFVDVLDVLDTISLPEMVEGVGTIKVILRLVSDKGLIIEDLRQDLILESDIDTLFGLFEEMDNWVVQPYFEETEQAPKENYFKDLQLKKYVLGVLEE